MKRIMESPYLPLFVDMTGKDVLVIGGGRVAERKVDDLMGHGCVPTVVSPCLTERLEDLATEGSISVFRRGFAEGDVIGRFLVIAATDDPETNRRVARLARDAGALVCETDIHNGEVIIPSVLSRGRLQVAVSTAGASPYLSRSIRLELERHLDEAYGPFAELLSETRELARRRVDDPRTRERLLRRACSEEYLDRIRAGEVIEPETFIEELLEDEDIGSEEAES